LPLKNPVWFQLVSHKLCRLLCPWALLVLFGASGALAFRLGLPAWQLGFWRTAFFGQIAFYVLSALGARAGKLGTLARSFTVLNAAAVVGFWRFASGRQAVTW
jgi:hypothetical protein